MSNLIEQLRRIGLRADASSVDALLQHAQKNRLSHVQILEQLAEIELREREARNLQRRTHAACLGAFKTLDAFQWAHPRSIDRNLYERLYESLDFIPSGDNVLLRGQAGVGKTTLAQNLGLKALQGGYSVRFSTLSAAMADLLMQESLPAVERRLKRYTLPHLLILDELGYLPCDSRAADLLFHIVSRRHEKRSIVITTNLAYKQWTTVFPDAACLSALIDRFAQHCHVIDIDAESWRDLERRKNEKKRKESPSRKS